MARGLVPYKALRSKERWAQLIHTPQSGDNDQTALEERQEKTRTVEGDVPKRNVNWEADGGEEGSRRWEGSLGTQLSR